MQLKTYENINSFIHENLFFLERAEIQNNYFIEELFNFQKVNKRLYFGASVFNGDQVVLSAFQGNEESRLIVHAIKTKLNASLKVLLDYIISRGITSIKIFGPKYILEKCCERFKDSPMSRVTILDKMIAHKISLTNSISKSEGHLDYASKKNVAIIAEWINYFEKEVTGQIITQNPKEIALKWIKDKKVFVWNKSKIVSMAIIDRKTKNTIAIKYVYTSKLERKKGYGKSIVLSLSKFLLKNQVKFCTLFTDSSNRTTNKIYQDIGYTSICDFWYIKIQK